MAQQDYYKTLGVGRDASDDEIKRAFRKLAKKYHPDVTGGDKTAEERFKAINEAYEVLGDAEKRQQYDQFGQAGPPPGFDPRAGGGFQGVDLEDILRGMGGFGGGGRRGFGGTSFGFEEVFGGGGGFRGRAQRPGADAGPPPTRGADLRLMLDVDFGTAARGGQTKISYQRQVKCDTCGGSGKQAGGALRECPQCGGRGKVSGMQGPIQVEQTCPVCAGTGKTSLTTCSSCHGEGRVQGDERLTVKIPEGVADGGKIRLAGKGNAGTRGGWPGDLIVELDIKPHPHFRREGKDISLTCPITPAEAVDGTKVKVPTLDGYSAITIPPGVRSGQRLRLRNKGIRDPRGKGARGHQYVELQIVLPKELDEETKQKLRAIDEETGFDPRKGVWE